MMNMAELLRRQKGQPYVPGNVIDPMRYGLTTPMQSPPSAQQYSSQELDSLIGNSSFQEERDSLARQMARAANLRNTPMRQPDSIRMSSGTMYTPAISEGEAILTGLQRALGEYQTNKIEKRDAEMRKMEAEERRRLLDRILNPRTEVQQEIDPKVEEALANAKMSNVEQIPLNMWDKLRNFGRRVLS